MHQTRAGIKWVQPHQLSWGWAEWSTPWDNHTHTSAGKIGLSIFILLLFRKPHLKKTRSCGSLALPLPCPRCWGVGVSADPAGWWMRHCHRAPIVCQGPLGDNGDPASSLTPLSPPWCPVGTGDHCPPEPGSAFTPPSFIYWITLVLSFRRSWAPNLIGLFATVAFFLEE